MLPYCAYYYVSIYLMQTQQESVYKNSKIYVLKNLLIYMCGIVKLAVHDASLFDIFSLIPRKALVEHI